MSQIIPTGTIVPYAGNFTEDSIAALNALGWLPCDGASYPKKTYIYLALSISNNFGGTGGFEGNFNVPDLRGRFLRGVSNSSQRDPDTATRTAISAGGNTGNNVGSLQNFATSKPNIPFTTDSAGQHLHNVPHLPVNNNAYAIAGSHYGLWNEGSVTTSTSGNHIHTLSGFDTENRPINSYVNFIIKFSDQ
ncbi:phage tail protein [Flavobacterium artemisiae]|uniref:Phage tail protein n=1 Tax=Flavobacterium artemisiae TaxID=2126556 RepID=A0ABW4H7V8_9FLAO